MNLKELLAPWIEIDYDLPVLDVHNDSRQVKPGTVFLAYPGALQDGRLYMQQAWEKGACAIVYEAENNPNRHEISLPCIPLAQLASKIPTIARRFFQDPSKTMKLTGVTGTNGKTTIAYQLAQALQLLEQPAAYIGTIGQGQPPHLSPLENTTPDALCLQRLLHEYSDRQIGHVCMEVSSHALSQQRVQGISFQQAIFTNLTLDHLDYHQTMEEYAKAKASLFAFPDLKWAIINQDDAYAAFMAKAIPSACEKISYGINAQADVQAIQHHVDLSGTRIGLTSPWGKAELFIKSLGYFNIYNALAIFCSLMAQGYDKDKVVAVMRALNPAPGRMQVVNHNPCVMVDYAHTPDALENVLQTLTSLKEKKLIVVFGCGGDRDKSKRPLMGEIAARYADTVIITSDNPRSEDPDLIIDQIKQGISSSVKLHCERDRKKAIEDALSRAQCEDIILIAGKGHENYQQIGHKKYPFSDEEVIKQWTQCRA